MGEGAVVVLCIDLMSLLRPNFHSISDWAYEHLRYEGTIYSRSDFTIR